MKGNKTNLKITRIKEKIKTSEFAYILAIISFSLLVCAVSVKINIFRYNNFDFGKFDLGNMTQMVWNTARGRFMYLTDYFGSNVPRWSMSHVDPILVLFVPIFVIIPHPLTLVFAQLFLTSFVAPLYLFKLAKLVIKSNLFATLISISYLLYPALGYLNTQTGFHGVSAAIPFFIIFAYLVEKTYRDKNYSKKRFALIWLVALITISGKEQLPLYIMFYCLYVLAFKTPIPQISGNWLKEYIKHPMAKNFFALFLFSLVWLILAFFVIIPHFASYRIKSYQAFTQELGIDTNLKKDVTKPNYFLNRYEEFGNSYYEIVINMLLDHKKLIRVLLGGDKLDNFTKTFLPVLYLPFLAPQTFVAAIPDLIINYATTSSGIGTSEISNHRISMIIPVIFISTIIAINSISLHIYTGFLILSKRVRYLKNIKSNHLAYLLAAGVLAANIYTTFSYNNPVFLWFTQAIKKRINKVAHAKFDREIYLKGDLVAGQRFRISSIENKDRECAKAIVNMIPKQASVSGPDYLGAHLAQRETYAIFPALYSKADYVIVDVFSQKIMRILDTDISIVRDVVGDMLVNPNYENIASCGNLFVFKKSGAKEKSLKLPIQERYKYPVDKNLEIMEDLFVADFFIPQKIKRGEKFKIFFAYRKESKKPDGYILFTTFINSKTGEIYQIANMPSYGLLSIDDWDEGSYYLEEMDTTIPYSVKPGSYLAFVGMTNNIRSRSIYLTTIEIL